MSWLEKGVSLVKEIKRQRETEYQEAQAVMQRRSSRKAYHQYLDERDQMLEKIGGATKKQILSLKPDSFRRWRSPADIAAILKQSGLDPDVLDPANTPIDVMEALLEDVDADKNGVISFTPGILYLGFTEKITVPTHQSWALRSHLYNRKTQSPIPNLTAHLSAPILHPIATGFQAIEVIHHSPKPIPVCIADLACVAVEFPLDRTYDPYDLDFAPDTFFSYQTDQRPHLKPIQHPSQERTKYSQ